VIIPLFVKTTDTASPTVMQSFFRQVHPELINAIQAGRADQAYAQARLLAYVAVAMQPRPMPVPVTAASTTWKEWRRSWSKSLR
jgi:hypothetical protein